MRARFLFPALLLAALAVASAILAAYRHHAPAHHWARDNGPVTAAPPARPGFGGDAPGWTVEVIPMHQAVRRVSRRFDGRVLDIALLPPASGPSPLVYRVRLLTRAGDVLEIRMDALDGRFLELRGADLSEVRRGPPNRKD